MIKPNFRHQIGEKKLATAIAQDYETNEILMVAFIDEEAFIKTIEEKTAYYYSTSRNQIWHKGESSGHTQEIKEIKLDCDMDAIIFKVKQNGGACHTGHYSCFYKTLEDNSETIKEDNTNLVFNPDDVY